MPFEETPDAAGVEPRGETEKARGEDRSRDPSERLFTTDRRDVFMPELSGADHAAQGIQLRQNGGWIPSSERSMPDRNPKPILELPAELAGDAGELLSAIGTAEALPGLSSVLAAGHVRKTGASALRNFLTTYVTDVLLPVELPAVITAWTAAEECHLQDLLTLDRSLSANPTLREFRAASAAVGRRQLNKLRPLRDQRFVQRYRMAMEHGDAAAWHTIVYGIVLSLYSLPLRDGVQHLALQTVAGFALSAAPEFGLRLSECEACLQAVADELPERVNKVLTRSRIHSLSLFTDDNSNALV